MKINIISLADISNTIMQSLMLVLIPNYCIEQRYKNSKLKLLIFITFFLTALILSPHYHRNHINNKYRTHNTAVKSVQLLILICKQPHHNTSTAQYDHIIYS